MPPTGSLPPRREHFLFQSVRKSFTLRFLHENRLFWRKEWFMGKLSEWSFDQRNKKETAHSAGQKQARDAGRKTRWISREEK
jgi:hypothetical protein